MKGDMARTARFAKHWSDGREAMGQMLGWLLSGQSVQSGEPLLGAGRLSAKELNDLAMICAPYCDQCGLPFDRLEEDGQVCAACIASPPLWDKARAPFAYDQVSSRLILSLKRRGERNGLGLYARYMLEAGRELIDTADVLVPVPVHYRRLVSRGFNQAGWLASAISRLTDTPVAHAAIRRVKATPSQGKLSAGQRRRNVAGAFALTQKGRSLLAGQRVVLVDDVLTTGATLNACVRTLRQAKPANVDVITLTRVVAPKNALI